MVGHPPAGVAGAGRPTGTFLHVTGSFVTGSFAGPDTCRLDTPGDPAYCVAVGDALLA
jgi:hypothetical protein